MACATPTQRGHKRWYYALRVDTTARDDVQTKRGGFDTYTAASAALEHLRSLLAVAGTDDRARRRIGDMVVERSKRQGDLPSVEEVRRKVGAGVDPTAEMLSVDELIDDWLAPGRNRGKRTHRLRSRSASDYRAGLRYFSRALGSMSVDRVTADHVLDVIDWIHGRNDVITEALEAGRPIPADPLDPRTRPRVVSDNSIRYYHGLFSMLLSYAVTMKKLIVRNPCDEVQPPPHVRYDAQAWGREEVVAFLAGTAGDRLHALYRVALLAGLRRGEVCGLQWQDFSDGYRVVSISRSVQYVSLTSVIQGGVKTAGSVRQVSLDEDTAGLLRALHRQQRRERLAAGAAWRGDDWCFTALDGFPVRPSAVAAEFKRRTADLGLPVIRFHDVRHTHATLLFEAKIDSKIISARLGHSSERVTREVYTHVRPAVRDEVAGQVVDFVFGDAS